MSAKPLARVYEFPERLPKAGRVTIATGFLGHHGVVLAADTEESYQETKTSVNKVNVIYGSACHAGIAGSGDSYLIEFMVPKIRKILRSGLHDYEQVQTHLQQLMAAIYASNELQSYPADAPKDKYVDLLVACRIPQKEAALFIINSSLVTRAPSLGAYVIGCGPLRDVAEELGRLCTSSVSRSAWAALYLVYLAKQRYQGVGGKTHVLKIWNDGRIEDERVWDQARREHFFSTSRMLNNIMMLEITDLEQTDKEFNSHLRRLAKEMRDLRKQIREIEERYVRTKLQTDFRPKVTKGDVREYIRNKKQAKIIGPEPSEK
jgi:hypothetical protein